MPDASLTVATYNTFQERKGRDPALDALLGEEGTMICLQEVNTHLPYESGLRNRCLDLLPRLIGEGESLVVGDLNATTQNPFLADFLLKTGLRPAGTEEPTHDTGSRIDFVLYRGGFREVGYSLTESLSDHRLVRVELEV